MESIMEKEFLTDLIITKIHSVTTMYNETGSRSKRTYRPYCAIVIKYSGETEYTYYDGKYISNKNNMVILPKGSAYEWTCTKSGHYSIIEFDCDKTLDKILSFPISNSEKILKIFKDLEYKRTLREPLYELECIRDTYDIILKLLQASQRAYQPATKQRKIQPAVDYIAQSLGYLNIYDFSRTFKKYTGVSPTNYLKLN